MRRRLILCLALSALPALLAGCGKGRDKIDALDNEIAGGNVSADDEAVPAAEAPSAGGKSGTDHAQINPHTRACAERVAYSADWARRLPADLPLVPGARVAEAAGVVDKQCNLRIVSFAASMPLPRLSAWYADKAKAAGYSADSDEGSDGDHRLAGTRARDGAAYILFMTPRGDGGTNVDLVVTGA